MVLFLEHLHVRVHSCGIPVAGTNSMAVGKSPGSKQGRPRTLKQEVNCECLADPLVNFQLRPCPLPRTWEMGLSPPGRYGSMIEFGESAVSCEP